jgi:hypothetical protein
MSNGDTVSPRSLRINAYQVSETTQVSLAYSSTGLPPGLSFCPIGVPQRTQFMLLLPVSFSEPRWQPDVSVRWYSSTQMINASYTGAVIRIDPIGHYLAATRPSQGTAT